MASKTISITKEVYENLSKIKQENESFSELFTRILKIHHQNIEKLHGSWKLSKKEEEEIWNSIDKRPSRKWDHLNEEELI